MASIKKSIRTNQVLEVIKLSKDGKSIAGAFREVRIARSTFYLFCQNNPAIIANYRELELSNAKKQILAILANKHLMIQRMCVDATAPDTPPLKRLKIIQYMDELIDRLVLKLEERRPKESKVDIREILTGPELIPGKSRYYAARDRTGLAGGPKGMNPEIPADGDGV